MDRLLIYVCVVLVLTNCSQSDDNNDTLSKHSFWSQTSVDNFPPHIKRVTGTVYISGSDITDLSNLRNLEKVGNLYIVETGLTSLEGLNNINEFVTAVTGGGEPLLHIQNNPYLSDLSALQNAGNSIFSVAVFDNPLLTNLRGIGIQENGGFIRLRNNGISQINVFSNARTLESLDIHDNPNLSTLGDQGFSNLTTLRSIEFSNLPSLQDLTGLESLESVIEFRIWNCEGLRSLDGINNLTTVGNSMRLENLEGLENIAALSNFGPDIPRIELIGLDNLSSLTGLNNVETAGTIKLDDLNSLNSLEGLNNLNEVIGNFEIFNMMNLSSLGGLESLNRTGEFRPNSSNLFSTFNLFNLPQLTSIQSLDNLSFMGRFSITECNSLVSLDGLENVTDTYAVGAVVQIQYNSTLTDFCGLTAFAQNNNPYIVQIAANAYNPNWGSISSVNHCSQ